MKNLWFCVFVIFPCFRGCQSILGYFALSNKEVFPSKIHPFRSRVSTVFLCFMFLTFYFLYFLQCDVALLYEIDFYPQFKTVFLFLVSAFGGIAIIRVNTNLTLLDRKS